MIKTLPNPATDLLNRVCSCFSYSSTVPIGISFPSVLFPVFFLTSSLVSASVTTGLDPPPTSSSALKAAPTSTSWFTVSRPRRGSTEWAEECSRWEATPSWSHRWAGVRAVTCAHVWKYHKRKGLVRKIPYS